MHILTDEEIKKGKEICSGCHNVFDVISLYECPHCGGMFCDKCSLPHDQYGSRICIRCKSNIYLKNGDEYYNKKDYYAAYDNYKNAANIGNSEAKERCEELRQKLNIK